MKNRSVPADIVLPHMIYRDVEEAIAWLTRVFGFEEHYRYGGGDQMGAQLRHGRAYVMIRNARGAEKTPDEAGFCTQSLTLFVEDVEQHLERTRVAGARIVEELQETMYGELQYAAVDLAGHHWLFSRHAKDIAPQDWGAVVAEARAALPGADADGKKAINLSQKLGLFQEQWTPKVIAEMNDYQFKLVKIQGDFVWHHHADTDETFLVLEGTLRIDFRDGPVTLGPGEMFIVPMGVEHKPFAEHEVKLMLIEPRGVLNTGEAVGERTAQNDVWI